jgi:hypothetical protein
VRIPASEVRVVKSFFERSMEWTVEGRAVSVLGSHASNSLLLRMRVCSPGTDEVAEDISAGSRSVLARPR